MDKQKTLMEFEKKFVYTELEDNPDSIIDSLEVVEHLNDDIFPFEIKQFISNLIDAYEAEKKEAVREILLNYSVGSFSEYNFNHHCDMVDKYLSNKEG